MHNADQLSDWCLSYLAQSYNQICRKYPKVLRNLYPENQAWLNVHRWPPIWLGIYFLASQILQFKSEFSILGI